MKHIKSFFAQNKIYALLCILLWLSALAFGMYKANISNDSAIPGLSGYSAGISDVNARFIKIFFNSFKIHFCYTATLVICASFIITFPLTVLIICFKGYCTGFVAICIMKCFGIAKGSGIAVFSLVLPYFAELPVLFAMYVLSLKYQISRLKIRINNLNVQKKNEWLLYAVAMTILFACLCLLASAESFVVPMIMKLIL